MNKRFSLKSLIVLLVVVTGVTAIGVCLYNGKEILDSENLKIIIAQRIAESTDMQVSIGGAELYLLKGARIILTDFSMEGREETISLKARKVNVGFSLISLILGKLHLRYVHILKPDASIHLDNLLKQKPGGKKNRFPRIKVVSGAFKAIYKEREMDFHNINGVIDDKSLKMIVGIPSGEAVINAGKQDGSWEGELSVTGIDLKTVYPKIDGAADLDIGFKMIDNMVYLKTHADCPRMSLPLGGKDLEHVVIDIRSHATKDTVVLDKIAIQTDTVDFSGSAAITGNNNKVADAILDLNLSSSRFSYEKLVSHLPVDRLSFWLHKVFFEMLRDGEATVTELKYKGPLKDFKDKETLFFNLFVKANVTGMTYGAGYRPERITNLQGTLVLADNRLVLNKIAGMAGKTKIVIDEFYIPHIACRGFDMFLRMDLDMSFQDFVYGWKAALMPQSVNDIFGKMHDVKSGRIFGGLTYQKSTASASHKMKCDVDLRNATFFWKESLAEAVEAHITTEDFGRPLKVTLKGRLDDLPIENLAFTMDDPFYERRYRFLIKALGLPDIPGFKLENDPVILLAGTGKDRIFESKVTLSSRGFSLFKNSYKPVSGIFKGQAALKGQLGPELSFAVSDGVLTDPPGNNIDLAVVKKGKNGSMTLKGNVSLYHTDQRREIADLPVKGGLQVAMNWQKAGKTTGMIQLTGMQYPYADKSGVLDGTIEMKGNRLSTQGLMIVMNDTDVMVSGFLNNRNSHFVGDLDVRGYKLEKLKPGDNKGFQPPESFSADVYLDMSDLDIMGMAYTRGKVLLSIDKSGVTLDSLDLQGNTSRVSGSAFMGPKQPPRFDLDVDFRNESLEKWFDIIAPNRLRLKGIMHLYGNLHGTMDDINGRLKFAAKNGHIQSFVLISNLFAVLNPYKIFKDKELDLGRKGFSYNVISSTFNLQHSFIKFEDFYLDSSSIQLSSMGNFDIKTKQIDAVLGVQPLESLDKAISAIPIVGSMLTGSDNKLILISLKITGNVHNPVIRIARRDTLSEPMTNSLLRILELPETLLESSKELITVPKE